MTIFNRKPTSAKEAAADLLRGEHTINGAIIDGVDGALVEIQSRAVDVFKAPSPWEKAVKISGIPKTEASALIARIGGALAKIRRPFSPVKIAVNVHPEGRGVSLDLPIALAVMQAAGIVAERDAGDFLIFGAVDLHGDCRHTPGALALCMAARHGQRIIFPQASASQAVLCKAERDVRLYPVASLAEAAEAFAGRCGPELKGGKVKVTPAQSAPTDFADIIGQEMAKRAATIAAAGGHGLLMVGTPGCGKTLLANAIAGILPPLANSEKVELTRIYGAAGKLADDAHAITTRPFRAVHHSATTQSLIGGGRDVEAGEVTLAHRGVLFLDELPQFRPDVLEALRQPIEDGAVSISRVHRKTTLPCRFSLVAAMNPCPCGYNGEPQCQCSAAAVQKYQSTISGPLLDRFDLKVKMDVVTPGMAADGETTADVRARVILARELQRDRYRGTAFTCNADVPGPQIRRVLDFTPEALELLGALAAGLGASLRGHDRMAKVARTIADLAGSPAVLPEHVTEAEKFA